jgi:hypothetical protein
MATQAESVVTPERFNTGVGWQEWMAKIDQNQEGFQNNYDDFSLTADEIAAFKALMAKPNGPAKVLVIGEPWCPDVVRGLPPVAKLAEATGIDMKIVWRDQNIDIMNEFLNKGEFQSIPTMVFYTKDHEYLGHWIERAKKADDEMHLSRAISGKIRDESLSQAERDQATADYAAFRRGPVWDGWRHAEIAEMVELLENATK